MSDRRYTDEELHAAFIDTFDNGISGPRELIEERDRLRALDVARPLAREQERCIENRMGCFDAYRGPTVEEQAVNEVLEDLLRDTRRIFAIPEGGE